MASQTIGSDVLSHQNHLKEVADKLKFYSVHELRKMHPEVDIRFTNAQADEGKLAFKGLRPITGDTGYHVTLEHCPGRQQILMGLKGYLS